MIVTKSPEEIAAIAASGRVLSDCLEMLTGKARAGVTTLDLDTAAERFITGRGARPAFKGYRGFPASICTSPNSMIVHGIPDDRPLARGDVLAIDVGVDLDGWIADAAVTLPIGKPSRLAGKLLSSTRTALFDAVDACQVGGHLGDIGAVVQGRVEPDGFSVVRELVGHGVGRSMHEDPQIPNYGTAGTGVELREGMVVAIEPMVTAGKPEIRVADDGWSVFSLDGSLAAHFEHTVAITADGPQILTPWHEEGPLSAA